MSERELSKRSIPAVHRFTTDPHVARFAPTLGPQSIRSTVEAILESVRASNAAVPSFDALRARVVDALVAAEAEGLINAINATGVVLHTNFGRAPLAKAALEAVTRLGSGYTNLEFDLARGERGSRYDRVASQLQELTGAEAALVVNNCAAAVLLVLDTFAMGREVVVSRGQLIEIGGGFRLPDVLRKSGATLVEAGTTNRTYPSDYRNAWTPNTAMFMRTHPSNYRVEGFTTDVSSRELAALARELAVISFEDLGSGALIDLARFGLPHEPTLAEEVAAGLDLVAVSGDKLLGGPQCGIIVGRRELVDRLRRNPLLRALRVDKMTLAGLSATLSAYLEPDRLAELPVFAMLSQSRELLQQRAEALCARIAANEPRVSVRVVTTDSTTGGGTLPLAGLPSAGIAVRKPGAAPDDLAASLRRNRPPVVGRIEGDDVILDLRTVFAEEEPALALAIASL